MGALDLKNFFGFDNGRSARKLNYFGYFGASCLWI